MTIPDSFDFLDSSTHIPNKNPVVLSENAEGMTLAATLLLESQDEKFMTCCARVQRKIAWTRKRRGGTRQCRER